MGESWARRAAGIGLVAGTALVLSSVSATAAPEGEIRNLGASNAVKDNYIVVLKDISTSSVENLSAKYGAKVKHSYKSALRGFSAQMSETQAKRLAADPAVAYVEQDGEVRASDTQTPTPSWGLDRIDQRALPLDNSYTYPNTRHRRHRVHHRHRHPHHPHRLRRPRGVRPRHRRQRCRRHRLQRPRHPRRGHRRRHEVRRREGREAGRRPSPELLGLRHVRGRHRGHRLGHRRRSGQPGPQARGRQHVPRRRRQPDRRRRRGPLHRRRRHLRPGGRQRQRRQRLQHVPGPHPEAITVGSTDRTDVRSSFSNLGTCLDIFAPAATSPQRLAHQRQGHQHHQRHLDGHPARGRRGSRLPRLGPDRHPAAGPGRPR